MQGIRRIFSIVCVVLILLFGLIHLGVGIGILARFHRYGNVFRPERGLAAWNIVISILALAIGILGLFSVITNRGILSKIVAFASIVLAFFAFVSLITALIINSLAITYVSSRFSDYMNQFSTDQDSRNIINKIQIDHNCCGTNTWLDWSNVALNATEMATTTAGPAGMTTGSGGGGGNTTAFGGGGNGTTTASGGGGGGGTTTASGGGSGGTTTASGGGSSGGGSVTTTASGGANGGGSGGSGTTVSSRKRRQTQSSYGGVYGLPLSFGVTMPQSCCTADQSSTNDSQNLYCVSNTNNVANSFYTNGCSKELGKLAVGQTLGLSVINSFLVVIALATMVALFEPNPYDTSLQGGIIHQPPANYGPGDYNVAYPPDTSYNNYNAGY